MEFSFDVIPAKVPVSLFGMVLEISETVIYSSYVVVFIILLALVFRIFIFPKFKDKPAGVQNVIELIVGAIRNYTIGVGTAELSGLGGYIFTLVVYMVGCGLLELLGFRSPLTDIQQTAVLALVSFVIINAYGLARKGFVGRVKHFFPPFVAPIRMVTELAIPVSMACRLFGNMVGGLIIMDLLYMVCAPIIPGILSLYFTLFHVGMQTYIFITLTLTFTHEAIE